MKVKLKEIKPNPNNPRYIKDEKFEKLKKSITDFPQMLTLKPLVVDENMVVLGGNMRLKALTELGIKEVEIIKASDLTEEQKAEFIIKDNIGFGEWDWDILANEWDSGLLDDWGMDVWQLDKNSDLNMVNTGDENDEWVGMPDFETKDNTLKIIVSFDNSYDREQFAKEHKIEFIKKQESAWMARYPYEGKDDLNSLKYE
tara:strand:+ start:320 stop:919 length:600 start_codon:yes stop_codon:yes gene_type:complete